MEVTGDKQSDEDDSDTECENADDEETDELMYNVFGSDYEDL